MNWRWWHHKRKKAPEPVIQETSILDRFRLKDKFVKIAFLLGLISQPQCRVLRIIDNEKNVKELQLDDSQLDVVKDLVKKKVVRVKNEDL